MRTFRQYLGAALINLGAVVLTSGCGSSVAEPTIAAAFEAASPMVVYSDGQVRSIGISAPNGAVCTVRAENPLVAMTSSGPCASGIAVQVPDSVAGTINATITVVVSVGNRSSTITLVVQINRKMRPFIRFAQREDSAVMNRCVLLAYNVRDADIVTASYLGSRVSRYRGVDPGDPKFFLKDDTVYVDASNRRVVYCPPMTVTQEGAFRRVVVSAESRQPGAASAADTMTVWFIMPKPTGPVKLVTPVICNRGVNQVIVEMADSSVLANNRVNFTGSLVQTLTLGAVYRPGKGAGMRTISRTRAIFYISLRATGDPPPVPAGFTETILLENWVGPGPDFGTGPNLIPVPGGGVSDPAILTFTDCVGTGSVSSADVSAGIVMSIK